MQQSHTARGCDLAEVARGCGIADSWQVSTLEELQAVRERVHTRGSVRLLHARVATDDLERVMPTRDAVANKLRFRAAIDSSQERQREDI